MVLCAPRRASVAARACHPAARRAAPHAASDNHGQYAKGTFPPGWPLEATLEDALARQYDGSYRKAHWGASAYNEIIIGSMFWEANLPWAVEAFVYAEDKDKERISGAHRRFLDFYGLSSEEVPLLRYACFVAPLEPANRPAGECFEDVS